VITAHFYGDSFVAGFGDPTGLGWVGRVATRAKEQGQPFRAVNHGVPGATSVDVVARWLAATADPRNAGLPDTKAVFSFGTNDVIAGVSAEQSLDAVAAALDRADEIGIPAFVIGPPPVGDLPAADAELEGLSSAFEAICSARGVPFVGTHRLLSGEPAWREETQRGDGSHPQATGYAVLADFLVASGLLEWIADRP
jgi:lysophospholipase L1-like esterase